MAHGGSRTRPRRETARNRQRGWWPGRVAAKVELEPVGATADQAPAEDVGKGGSKCKTKIVKSSRVRTPFKKPEELSSSNGHFPEVKFKSIIEALICFQGHVLEDFSRQTKFQSKSEERLFCKGHFRKKLFKMKGWEGLAKSCFWIKNRVLVFHTILDIRF